MKRMVIYIFVSLGFDAARLIQKMPREIAFIPIMQVKLNDIGQIHGKITLF